MVSLRAWIGSSLLLAAAAAGAWADELTMKDGRTLEGKVVEETAAAVKIELLNGSVLHIPRADVIKIERGKSVAEQVAEQLEALQPGNLGAYVEVGRFCLERKPLVELGRRVLWVAVWLDPARASELLVTIGDSITHPREKGHSWHVYQRARLVDPANELARGRIESYPADLRAAAGEGEPLDPPAAKAVRWEIGKSAAELGRARFLRAGTVVADVDVAAGRVVWHAGKWMTPAEKRSALGAPPGPDPPDRIWAEETAKATELPTRFDRAAPPDPLVVYRTVFTRGGAADAAPAWDAAGDGFSLRLPLDRGRTAEGRALLLPPSGAAFRFPPAVSGVSLAAGAEFTAWYRVTGVVQWTEHSGGREILVTAMRTAPIGFELRATPGGPVLDRWR